MSKSAAVINTTAHQNPDDSKTVFGFWLYLMTDCVLFASLFATFAVLHGAFAGGPGPRELFDLPFILLETMILLTSSFTCGLGLLAAYKGRSDQVLTWFGITFALGLAFLGMELYEFSHLVLEGHSWRESAYLSAYFTLVGTHGLHITVGLIWIAVLLAVVIKRGLNVHNVRRLALLSLFWHFLDIVWIFIFTFVYLMGVA